MITRTMTIKAVIFDMDGVLIDSIKYVLKSFNEVLKKDGVHITKDEMSKFNGRPLEDMLAWLKRDHNITYSPEEFEEKALALQLKLMREEFKDNKKLINLIETLKAKDLKLAVATSSLRGRAEKILGLLEVKDYFDVILTAEDVTNHKPNPEVFLKAAKKLGVNPEECVVIEDAANGIQAAKKGGMKAIALLTEFQTKKELKDADFIIDSLDELNEKLDEL
ncbi:MAG: HAD family phosphatase [archaeon]